MRVLYDISLMGFACRFNRRTGIFRTTEALACHLLDSEACEIEFSAATNLHETMTYLASEFPSKRRYEIPAGFRQHLNGYFDSATMDVWDTKGFVQQTFRIRRKVTQFACLCLGATAHSLLPESVAISQVFHSSFNALPDQIKQAKHIKRFLTVHDLLPVTRPEYFNADPNGTFQKILASVGPEDYIVANSHSTKQDACDYLKIEPSRVFVTHWAADPRLFYPASPSDQQAVRAKYNIPEEPYLLTLGTLEPRKNMDHVIRCFTRIANEPDMRGINLIITGSKGWDFDRIFGAMSEAKDIQNRIVWTGRVADEDLAALYSGALAFTYMSHYEGFGLPPLEAMQCGVPVVTSNNSSLPEVVGDAGVLLASDDADGLCQALLELSRDPERRNALAQQSLLRARQFSWERCAKQTVDAYKTALANS